MRPNYGIDAPILAKAFMAIGIAGYVLALTLGFGSYVELPAWLRFVISVAIAVGGCVGRVSLLLAGTSWTAQPETEQSLTISAVLGLIKLNDSNGSNGIDVSADLSHELDEIEHLRGTELRKAEP